MAVPNFVSDANLDDPKQHCAWAICYWPGVGKSQPYPAAPRPLIPHHSELLYDLGFRYHPELATKKKVVTEKGDVAFISVDEPDPVAPDVVDASTEALALLGQIDPELATRVATMDESERAAAIEAHKGEFGAAMESLQKIRDGFGV